MNVMGTCAVSGKVSFRKKEALSKAHWLKEEHGKRLRVYQCPYCNFWHLTHKRV